MCLYSVVVDSEYNFDFKQKSFKIIYVYLKSTQSPIKTTNNFMIAQLVLLNALTPT